MNVVVFPVHDRPRYLRRALASWRAARGCEQARFVFAAEPSPVLDEVLAVIGWFGRTLPPGSVTAEVNETVRGVDGNPRHAFERGFETARFVIQAEDDDLVSADVLEYFAWCDGVFRRDPAVLAACAFNPGGSRRPGAVFLDGEFRPTVCGLWADRWAGISAWALPPGAGWDNYIQQVHMPGRRGGRQAGPVAFPAHRGARHESASRPFHPVSQFPCRRRPAAVCPGGTVVRVLVTGGHGFIGRHVMTALADHGHEGVSFDLDAGQDVRYALAVGAAFGDFAPDHVIHLAGVLGTAELFADPHGAVDANIHGTLNVLQACETAGAGYTGITMPSVWSNPYQATKRCARDFASAWHQHRGVPVSHVRAFNAYGEGQKLGPVQKIIPTFADRAHRGEPLPVWGDGTQQVDLVHAGDVAEMLVSAMDFGGDEVLDAGTGSGMSVNEVAALVIAQAGSRSRAEYLPMRPGEHEAKCVATGEGWELTGWHPPVRGGELARTIASYRA